MSDMETINYLTKKYPKGFMVIILLENGRAAIAEHNPKQNGLFKVILALIDRIGMRYGGNLN